MSPVAAAPLRDREPWPVSTKPGKHWRTLIAKRSAQNGLASLLVRLTPDDPVHWCAACARLSPMAPTPPCNSNKRKGRGCLAPGKVLGGANRRKATFMSRSTCSKTPRLACRKLAGPKDSASPSRTSSTWAGAPPTDIAGRTCSQASGRSEKMALRLDRSSGSRQCTQMECQIRVALGTLEAPPCVSAGQSCCSKRLRASEGGPRAPFQTRTSCTRELERSTVN
mmetsp:Transcript_38364/g.105678  ORF Transcript_38364/g.105678 Transcript_38364/m.105678 type:complete len:224 (-) Transcript_38364:796-1467(-)